MKRLATFSVFLIICTVLASCAVLSAQPTEHRLTLTLKDVSFPDAIRQLFTGAHESYTVDASLNNLKVSATLKNIPWSQAIQVVSKTAGAVYRVENNTYLFSPKPRPNIIQINPGAAPVEVATVTQLINLLYLSAEDAAALLNAAPPEGLDSITATSSNALLLKGDEQAIADAKDLIRQLDAETALPRAVRVTIILEITTPGLSKPIVVSTGSVGQEGTVMPLNINSGEATGTYELDLKLTPTVLGDGSISLTGSGGIDCTFTSGPDSKGVSRAFNVSKAFEVAVSAANKPTVIASGSTDVTSGTTDFTISAIATVEKGRIAPLSGGLPHRDVLPPPAPRTPKLPAVVPGKPGDAPRRAADALLQKIWDAEPGKAKFDAIDAVAKSYAAGDVAMRNAVIWCCLTYMNDKSRGILDRWPCCYVISRCKYEKGIPALSDMLLTAGEETMRAVAAEALGELSSNADARGALVKAQESETNPRVLEVIEKYIGRAASDLRP